jgi:hypothetical protein
MSPVPAARFISSLKLVGKALRLRRQRTGETMTTANLTDAFPPAPDRLVTLANWRKAPFNAWGFRNVRRLVPTADIAASGHAIALETRLEDIGDASFTGHDGKPTTVGEALPATSTDAFIVLRRGRIAVEWYGNGMSAITPHIVFSVSKSICGALGGILAERGLLDPDASVIKYIPELASSVYASCTVRHLLDMAVGIAFNEDYDDPKGDVARYRNAVGWDPLPAGDQPIDLRSFLALQRPDGQKHGGLFHYVSTNTDVLGWVYERACGRAYADIVSEYLWQPLGTECHAYITVDAHNAMRDAARPRPLRRNDPPPRRREWPSGDARCVDRRYQHARRRGGVGAIGVRGYLSESKLSQPMVPDRQRQRRAGRVRHPRPVDLHPSRRRTRDHPHGLGSDAARSRPRARLAPRLRCDRGVFFVNYVVPAKAHRR